MSVSGGITCPTRRDHSHSVTNNQSRGWYHLTQAKCKITYLYEGEITFLLSLSGGITCPTRRDHSPSVTNNQSMGWDHITPAKCKITYLYEAEITFLFSVSGGITCRTDEITHLLSQIINLGVGTTYPKLNIRSLTCTKVRSLSYCRYLVGSPAQLGEITHILSQIINIGVGST